MDVEDVSDNEQDHDEQHLTMRITYQHHRDNSDPFSLPEHYFFSQYRMSRQLMRKFIAELRAHVPQQRSPLAIPFEFQVLALVRFLANGGFQNEIGTDFKHAMSQPSVSRCMDRVLAGILKLQNKYLRFPRTPEERRQVARQFRRVNRISSILGLIDCFVVTCIRPRVHEEAYFNYKHGPSVNVQIVTDSDYKILSLCVSAGTNNDQFIWNNSELKNYMNYLRTDEEIIRNEGKYYLLGDSGYSLSPIILTPILDAAEGSAEAMYTTEHVTTRCKVEQTIGILTQTWMALKRARKLYYPPGKVTDIIIAGGILHNYRRLHGIVDTINGDSVHYRVFNDGRLDDNYLAGLAEQHNLVIRHYR